MDIEQPLRDVYREAASFKTAGQLIESILEEKGWSKRTLAIVLGIGETTLNKVIAGKQPITPNLALALEDVLGEHASRFLDLQQRHELEKARLIARPDPSRVARATLFGGLPVAAMIKRRWLAAEDLRNVPEVEAALAKFFGVESMDDIPILPHAAKRTVAEGEPSLSQIAWVYRVRQLASEMVVPRYSELALRKALKQLGDLRSAAEEVRKVPRILTESGVRYLLVETLPAAKIDGACLWLDDEKPVIGMSLRHDRIDNFWFVLRHEIEHVLQKHGQTTAIIDTELQERTVQSDEDRIANDAAADFCVPKNQMERFIARKAPFFAERDILGFARTLGIHPGIVAGQLRHETSRYDLFSKHLSKIRHFIRPSAIVDGWGDVAPVGV